MDRRGLFSFLAAAPIGGAAMVIRPKEPEPTSGVMLPVAPAGSQIFVVNNSGKWLSVSSQRPNQ